MNAIEIRSLFFHDNQNRVHEIRLLPDGNIFSHDIDHVTCLGRFPSYEKFIERFKRG